MDPQKEKKRKKKEGRHLEVGVSKNIICVF
jgi:hypothetical protein